MPLEQNQLPTPDDMPAETPTHDDGNAPGHDFQPSPAPAAQQQDGDEPPEPQAWKDEKRGEIFARAREKRAAETAPFSGSANDPNALYGTESDQSDLGPLEQEAMRRRQEHLAEIAGQPPGRPQQQPRKPLNGLDPQMLAAPVPIIVDGQQHEVTMEDLIRDFQINRAADKRFEMAKALLQQSQEFQRTRPQPGFDAESTETSGQDGSTTDQDDFERDHGHTSRRPANVKDLVEKIQLGTPDEAAEALEEFISSASNREAPVDETTRVQTALEDINAKQAVLAFAQANPHIATNPVIQQEATKHIQRHMAEDLVRAGYSVDQLREIAPDAKSLTQLHKQARIAGLKGVRRVSDLIPAGYHDAVQNLRSLVDQESAPATAQHQAATMAQRQQRKESLQTQPVARRLQPTLNAPSQTRTQDQSRAAAVMRIRQARGQPT